jgi:hypothetical protein
VAVWGFVVPAVTAYFGLLTMMVILIVAWC